MIHWTLITFFEALSLWMKHKASRRKELNSPTVWLLLQSLPFCQRIPPMCHGSVITLHRKMPYETYIASYPLFPLTFNLQVTFSSLKMIWFIPSSFLAFSEMHPLRVVLTREYAPSVPVFIISQLLLYVLNCWYLFCCLQLFLFSHFLAIAFFQVIKEVTN